MIKIEKLEKMGKDACEQMNYELYKRACCELHLYVKICSQSCEVRASSALYNLLTNTKSESFLAVVTEIINSDDATCADAVVYCLLLSVRAQSVFFMAYLLNKCDEIQMEILNMIEEEEKSEKRE